MKNVPKPCTHIIGVDEVGRGPIAGPVTIGAVMIPVDFDRRFFTGIRDSKKLTKRAREAWVASAREARRAGALTFAVASVRAEYIDARGIAHATSRATRLALARLGAHPERTVVLLDNLLHAPKRFAYQKSIVRGDEREPVISLASIVAKVHRDRYMTRMGLRYPQYAFETHKGYGTRAHYHCLKQQGVCRLHRKSFLT